MLSLALPWRALGCKTKVLGHRRGCEAGSPLCCSNTLYLEEIGEALPEYAGGVCEELAVVFAELDKLEGQGWVVEELSWDISEEVFVDGI